MKNQRTKHSPTFKAKVALDAIREQETVAEIARRHKVHANMVYKWRQVALENLSLVFDSENTVGGPTAEREAELLRKIGELTVERDFLARGLARSR